MALPVIPESITKNIQGVVQEWEESPTLQGLTHYKSAVEALSVLQLMRREIESFFRELKRTANDHRKALIDKEKALLADAKPVEQHLNDLIVAFDQAREDAARDAAVQALKGPAGAMILSTSDFDVASDGYHTIPTIVPSVEDKLALVLAVSEGRIPLDALTPNLSFLRKLKEEHGDLAEVPGVTFSLKTTVVTHREK